MQRTARDRQDIIAHDRVSPLRKEGAECRFPGSARAYERDTFPVDNHCTGVKGKRTALVEQGRENRPKEPRPKLVVVCLRRSDKPDLPAGTDEIPSNSGDANLEAILGWTIPVF
jgi:hypothetical protein